MEVNTSKEVGNLLKQAAATVRAITQERDGYQIKLAEREKRERAEKVSSLMIDRGYLTEEDKAEKTAALIEGKEDLTVLEKALELTSTPEGVAKLAVVGEAPAGDALSQFEQFVISHGQVTSSPTDFSLVG